MVHALDEIRRALVPRGILIDLRPYAGRWPVEVISSAGLHLVGHVTDLPREVSDDQASDQALETASARGWYALEQRGNFPFYYYWDTPNEMAEYIREEWEDFIRLEESTLDTIRTIWATENADARVRMRLNMVISRWQKME
jgi:hypothetical protein